MKTTKWMPFRLVKPGQRFKYRNVEFLRIKGFTTIGKEGKNLVHIPTGEVGCLDGETAVRV